MTSDSDNRPLLPIACTLGPSQGADRLEDWRRISETAGAGHVVASGRVTMRFRDARNVGDELRRLVDAERDCCAFLGWELAHVEGEWHVDVTGTDEELQALPFPR